MGGITQNNGATNPSGVKNPERRAPGFLVGADGITAGYNLEKRLLRDGDYKFNGFNHQTSVFHLDGSGVHVIRTIKVVIP